MSDRPVIEGKRVRLRPLRIEDAPALHALYSDAGAMTWWTHGSLDRLDETEAKLADNLSRDDWRAWAITPADEDRAIGTVAAHEERQGRVAEIGYSLSRAHWGSGLAREAVGLLIGFLFEVEGYRRVFADTDPDNIASRVFLT